MTRARSFLFAAGIFLLVAALVGARMTPAPKPPPTPDFTLASPDGHSVSLDAYRGRWVLVYFGYSHCRSACTEPLAGMQTVAAARPDVAALFVTLDPDRDTTTTLGAFTRPVAPKVLALTGSRDAIEAAERAFGVYAVQHQTPQGVRYDRSNLIYVIDPKGKLVGHVDGGAPAGIIASSVGKPARA